MRLNILAACKILISPVYIKHFIYLLTICLPILLTKTFFSLPHWTKLIRHHTSVSTFTNSDQHEAEKNLLQSITGEGANIFFPFFLLDSFFITLHLPHRLSFAFENSFLLKRSESATSWNLCSEIVSMNHCLNGKCLKPPSSFLPAL